MSWRVLVTLCSLLALVALPVSASVVFSDDMESGTNGWTHGGYNDFWQLGDPTWTPSDAHSPSNCWATNLDGDYPSPADFWLKTPVVDLGTEGISLTFWEWCMIHQPEDQGFLSITTDGGASWTQLATRTGVFTNWEWQQATFDLSGYSGEAQFRFSLKSDASGDAHGWYIDDVVVCAEPGGGPVPEVPPSLLVAGLPMMGLCLRRLRRR